ncbi:MAG: hypothetical protein M3362_15595 [Acidobacteriota bacterium]|nr:hypothetical protein [Acidobacteriota bacterium]
MQTVIDSVSMLHLTRPPKRPGKSRGGATAPRNRLDEPLKLQKITLALDASLGLVSEWEKTCGPDIKVLVAHWGEQGGILLIQNPRNPQQAIRRRLQILGFGQDTVDKLILRIALGTRDRVIVSDDSDFWDPKKRNDNRVKGDPNAPVARLCREELGVTILLLGMLIDRLE